MQLSVALTAIHKGYLSSVGLLKMYVKQIDESIKEHSQKHDAIVEKFDAAKLRLPDPQSGAGRGVPPRLFSRAPEVVI